MSLSFLARGHTSARVRSHGKRVTRAPRLLPSSAVFPREGVVLASAPFQLLGRRHGCCPRTEKSDSLQYQTKRETGAQCIEIVPAPRRSDSMDLGRPVTIDGRCSDEARRGSKPRRAVFCRAPPPIKNSLPTADHHYIPYYYCASCRPISAKSKLESCPAHPVSRRPQSPWPCPHDFLPQGPPQSGHEPRSGRRRRLQTRDRAAAERGAGGAGAARGLDHALQPVAAALLSRGRAAPRKALPLHLQHVGQGAMARPDAHRGVRERVPRPARRVL